MGKEKTDTALETLIGDIYEAGMDAQGWPAVLQAILGHLDAQGGAMPVNATESCPGSRMGRVRLA